MDQHEAPTAHDAIRVRDPDEPYAGLPGQTRYECVHLVESDGSLRSVAVCRAINAQTHPELKARALSGLLHRLEDGRELALSFVYHDPDARKFALVVPSALAHLELKEWSKLMAEIAEDTLHAVPAYVREMTTVLGLAALTAFIDSEPELVTSSDRPQSQPDNVRSLELESRANRLAQRERDLAEQENALSRMAASLTSREGELMRQRQTLENLRSELEREVELREHDSRDGRDADHWRDVGRASDTDATVVSDLPRRVAGENAMTMSAASRVPPPLPANRVVRPASRPPPLPLRPRRSPPPLAYRQRDASFLGDELPNLGRLGSSPPPLPSDALVTDPTDPEPNLAPPAAFVNQRAGEMSYKLAEDELWLFVRLDEDHASAFRNAADLTLQYVEVEGYPVLVLSLVDQREPAYAVRLALDGRQELDMFVLEHLQRSFRARVALYVESLYIETVTVATLREGVAQAISEKIAKLPAASARATAADAIPRVLEVPPPLWNTDLPFGPVRREAPTIVTVLAAVEQLAAWLRPEKLNEATLTYSVPRHVIDATIGRVVRSAIAFGVALPDELLALAVEHGAASDEVSVVREQLVAFKQRVEHKQNDLGAEATRRNWDRLLAAADARQIQVDDVTQALARAETPQPAPEVPAGRVFETATAAELRQKLGDPLARIEAIRELCVRGHASAIEPVVNVLDALRPNEAAIALAQLLAFGENAGDRLIAALTSPSESVRQCAALALGKLQLRRALAPLLNQLETEESPAYAEIARAFGDFGAPALRSVVRVLPTSTRQDRLVLALAHVANHGSAKEVEKLENDPDPVVSQAARKAMARRARMEWEDLSVREQRTLTDASPAARLSQAFYAEASKVAI
jgi:hypothetical protein